MIYQLPNGKVIHLTVDEYLDLTDLDIQYMMSINAGNYAPSPFYGSSIRSNKLYNSSEDEDDAMDYIEDDPDRSHGDNIAETDVILDDNIEIPDEDCMN